MELKVAAFFAGFFVVGVVILIVVTRLVKNRDIVNDLWTLYLTEFVIVGLIVGPTLFGGGVLAVVITLLGLVSLWEFQAVVTPTLPLLLKWTGRLAGLGVLVAAYWVESATELYGVGLLAGGILLIVYIFLPISSEMPQQIGLVFLGILYPCLFLAHLLLIAKMPEGLAYIIFMYGVMETHDTFALLIGKLFGRRKIFPHLSPHKTYGGVLGGVTMGLLLAVSLGIFVLGFSWQMVFNGALIIIIFTLLGDLVASKLKRDVGVKDFGNFLPKQGGVLDIYDSLIFISPAFYLYVTVT